MTDGWIRDFEEGDGDDQIQRTLDLRAQVQEVEGVKAVEDHLVREGVIRIGANWWVKVTRVEFEGDPPPTKYVHLLPVFRFEVSDEARRPVHSFAIDADKATESLRTAYPTNRHEREPQQAFEIERVEGSVVRRAAERFLTIETVEPEVPPHPGPIAPGMRFAISDTDHRPLYSFTMEWPDAFLALTVAWEERPG